MTKNKATVEKYMDGFRASDHAAILSCLTDDVVWDMPGAFHLVGKDAFDKEIENEAFVGWGWEDRERVVRFEKLGQKILRVPGDCYHLEHPVGTLKSAWHADVAMNRRECERIAALSTRKLRAEIARWPRVAGTRSKQ